MENNKGFTLVEVISVIALLGLLIGLGVPGIMRASTNAKNKTLKTKINNIEKAAVLYGQDRRENFGVSCDGEGQPCEGKDINSCSCYSIDGFHIAKISVNDLLVPKDKDGNQLEEGYLKEDKIDENGNKVIVNSTDESKHLNNCKIQIYQKYGKIYAIYLDKRKGTDCWIQN